MPVNPLILKLEAFHALSEADKELLTRLSTTSRTVGPREDLIREGDPPERVYLILEGFACRYKILPDGSRHIMAYMVPGDLCDLHVFILKTMDHSIGTLSACEVVDLPRAQVMEMIERPAIARALWWSGLVDGATLREWLVNIGARSAEERVAHLLCELLVRLRLVGLATEDRYELPITQNELGDTMGLSTVHVNRVLQRLRAEGLIIFKSQKLVILKVAELMAFSGFNPNYLHLESRRTLYAARG
ncbi:MAG: Crp/Fnr family transcriptional regulator [Phenylobacterium sp.]|nr:MAG: Crp/Fnr family transcriptional regulator [Phenylobacterium sp.]